MTSTRIVIIAKAPIAGFAKTRLIPALGDQGAARLAERMLHHTVASALTAGLGPVELCATPAPDEPVWSRMQLSSDLVWTHQGEGDLGIRMARAAERTLSRGERVLLIGTDCPAIGTDALQRAARSLDTHDAFLLPSVDGGYALLGLRRFHPQLFHNIAWSTATVAFETLRRIAQLGWCVESPAPVHDIDAPADLRWLPNDWPESQPCGSE